MPRGKREEKKTDELEIEPIIPVTETPKVEEPMVEEPKEGKVEATSKPETQKPTGRFEKFLHEGKYYLVNVDGRILSSGDKEDIVDRMVMNLNNKRR